MLYACNELLEHLVRHMGVSVIFLGSQAETESIFQVSPRLERWVGTLCILRPFEWKRDEPETIHEFWSLMRTTDLHLLFDLSGLDEEEMAYRFFCAGDGIIGWNMKLISYAREKAISMQAATLSRSLFALAYDACIAGTARGTGKINPFAT